MQDFAATVKSKYGPQAVNLILCDPPWGVLEETHDAFSDHVYHGLRSFAAANLAPNGVLLLSSPWQKLHTWSSAFSSSDWHVHKSLFVSVLSPAPPQLHFSYTPKEVCTYWLLITRTPTDFYANLDKSTVSPSTKFTNVLFFPPVPSATLLKVYTSPLPHPTF